MQTAARALLVLIGAALVLNWIKGGPGRTAQWIKRTLTGG